MSDNPTATSATAAYEYTPDELAWFAETYGDTEWAVHVIGPDDVHVNEPDAQGEHNPDGKPLTEQSAWALADSVNRFNAWYRAKFGEKPAYTEDLIPNVFHRGVPVEARPVTDSRPFRVGDVVEITGPDGADVTASCGAALNGKTGVVAEIDDNPEYPIGLRVEGYLGLVWCGSTEIRHADTTEATR